MIDSYILSLLIVKDYEVSGLTLQQELLQSVQSNPPTEAAVAESVVGFGESLSKAPVFESVYHLILGSQNHTANGRICTTVILDSQIYLYNTNILTTQLLGFETTQQMDEHQPL